MLLDNSVYLIDFGISEMQSANSKKKRPFVGINKCMQEPLGTLTLQLIKDNRKAQLIRFNL